jgi:NAD(P)-dependent dehydrogenase (short-subunit alcohol dehydrogenase family)
MRRNRMQSLTDLMNIEGKTIVVTGAGSGIGNAVATGLAALGATVHGFDVNVDRLEQDESGADRAVRAHVCDVSDEGAVVDAFRTVVAESGVPDVVFAIAGIGGEVVPFEDLSVDGWNHTLNVNLGGAFLTAREAVRHMKPEQRGKIILTSSVWGLRGTIDGPWAAYGASKGGVATLTRQLAVDLGASGLTVNAIAPAGFRTTVAGDWYESEAAQSLLSQIPSGRFVDPEMMVGVAVFLASRASDHVNGHILAVDGGYLAA